jgi:hypothetical protein
VPVDQLLRRVDAEEQARGPLEYARSVVEYCSHVALRVEARRPDHLGDREFHTLTYDMMLAWEAPDEETDAVFQVRIQIGCLPPPVVRTNRHVILTREIPIKIQCWFFFPRCRKRHSVFSVETTRTTTTVGPSSIQARRRWPFRFLVCFSCVSFLSIGQIIPWCLLPDLDQWLGRWQADSWTRGICQDCSCMPCHGTPHHRP